MNKFNKIYSSKIVFEYDDRDDIITFNKYYSNINDILKDSKTRIELHYNNEEVDYTLDEYLTNTNCKIYVDVISTDRIIFESAVELNNYYKDNINKISNDNLYDFLLSLSDHETRIYNYYGDIIESDIILSVNSRRLAYEVNFTEESCSKGEYEFTIINKD